MMITLPHGRRPRVCAAVVPLVLLLVAIMAGNADGEAYTGPVKEILQTRIGAEVNKTTTGDTCQVKSEECQPARPRTLPGELEFGQSVAVNEDKTSPRYGDIYVVDSVTARVQELSPTGAFVAMLGWDVNKTKVEKGTATQQEMNLCTASEIKTGTVCQPGVTGTKPGQLGEDPRVAVDQHTGDIYVAERYFHGGVEDARVQEFAPDGAWLLEIGREVNETKDATTATSAEKDLCTRDEEEHAVKCGEAAHSVTGGTEPGAFVVPGALVVGGPEDLVYVGDEHRVQEFEANGTFKREIRAPLETISKKAGSHVTGLAVDDSCAQHEPILTQSTVPTCETFDPSNGDVYLVYEEPPLEPTTVYKFRPDGTESADGHYPLVLTPRPLDNGEHLVAFHIASVAVDHAGRLALGLFEETSDAKSNHHFVPFGVVLNGATGHALSHFTTSGSVTDTSGQDGVVLGLAFGASGELVGVTSTEVMVYSVVPVGELVARPATCGEGALAAGTSVTFDCALNGAVNPEGVTETEAGFEYGPTCALGSTTTRQTVTTGVMPVFLVPVGVEGVRPDEAAFCYRLSGFDANVKPPEEPLSSETEVLRTPVVAPRVAQNPSVPFVRASSAVFAGSINPENAQTSYFFQYAPTTECEALEGEVGHSVVVGECPGVQRTTGQASSAYGDVATIQEAVGLQPATGYRYRLYGTNSGAQGALDAGGGPSVPEGSFQTLPAPAPQAGTGAPVSLSSTSAVLMGSADTGGQAGTYQFELATAGDPGSEPSYEVVFSGVVPAGVGAVREAFTVGGLQPGSMYTYRIRVSDGFGVTYGQPVTFTTSALPGVLPVPALSALLPVPAIAFPSPEIQRSSRPSAAGSRRAKCRKGYVPNAKGRCVKAKPKHKARRAGKAMRGATTHRAMHGAGQHGKGGATGG